MAIGRNSAELCVILGDRVGHVCNIIYILRIFRLNRMVCVFVEKYVWFALIEMKFRRNARNEVSWKC